MGFMCSSEYRIWIISDAMANSVHPDKEQSDLVLHCRLKF